MSYYRHHVFVCCNQRKPGEDCCNAFQAKEAQQYMKERIAALALKGAGQVRINSSGCLGRCDEAPAMVIYPDNVWYTYLDRQDIDEIIREHLVNGRIVERLRLPDSPEPPST